MKNKIVLDYSKIEDVQVTKIDTRDYPDFCDAFIETATYQGRDMSEDELKVLNEDSEFIYNAVIERLF